MTLPGDLYDFLARGLPFHDKDALRASLTAYESQHLLPLGLTLPVDKVLAAADADWRGHAGEHDRSATGLLVAIFRDGAGQDFGLAPQYGVPKDAASGVSEWCGFAVGAWQARAGEDTDLRNAGYHVLNIEAHYTYGERALVNKARFKAEVFDPETQTWKRTRDYHAEKGALRLWWDWAQIQTGPTTALPFKPGDQLVIDWNGTGKTAEHTGLIVKYDGRFLTTREGNRHGKGPNGEVWAEAVVECVYDLANQAVRRQMYGCGRPSPLDFVDLRYR